MTRAVIYLGSSLLVYAFSDTTYHDRSMLSSSPSVDLGVPLQNFTPLSTFSGRSGDASHEHLLSGHQQDDRSGHSGGVNDAHGITLGTNTTHRDPELKDHEFRIDNKNTQWTVCWTVFLRVIQVAIIVGIIYLGAKTQTYNLDGDLLDNKGFTADIQVAIFGLVNQILSYLLENTVEHIVSITISIWLLSRNEKSPLFGARVTDFGLKDEMIKPWIAFIQYWKRRSDNRTSRFISFIRFLICFLVGICFLLQGLGTNTIGMPKQRWWPNYAAPPAYQAPPTGDLVLRTARMQITAISWDGLWSQANDMFGEDFLQTGQIVAAIAASQTFVGMGNLKSTMNSDRSNPGWYEIYNDNVDKLAGIYLPTENPNNTFSTIALQHHGVRDMWTDQRTKSLVAKGATGWTGILNVTLPMLSSKCIPAVNYEFNDTVHVDPPLSTDPSSSTMIVHVGAVSSTDFTGANCSIDIQQGLFPIGFWDYSSSGSPDVSVSNFGNPSWLTQHLPSPYLTPTYPSPTSSGDRDIANVLAAHMTNVFFNLNGLVQRGVSMSVHLHNLATSMTTLGRQGLGTDAEGYAPIVGSLAALLLSQGTWVVAPFEDGTEAVHGPIQWQTYGSGPRLGWEWAAVAIFAGIILVVFADLALLAWKRYGKVKLVEPGALLEVKRQVVSVQEDEERWFLRKVDDDQVLLTNNEHNNNYLERGIVYKWKDN